MSRIYTAVIETCAHGHKFGKMDDHPIDSGGQARCPYCMSIGLDRERASVLGLDKKVMAVVKTWAAENQVKASAVEDLEQKLFPLFP